MVANAGSELDMGIAHLQRGSGGRLEDAFLVAKAEKKAAFVAFVTAGFPTAQGKYS